MEKKIDFQKLMSEFAKDISNRTGLLTEDSVRYYVFKAFLSQDSKLNNYTLELPYESITYDKPSSDDKEENKYGVRLLKDDGLERKNGKLDQELDLYHSNNGEPICMEIKFHRHPTEVAFPHPQAAGSLFNDLQRLNLFEAVGCKKIHKLFLYVTDEEMNSYLGKEKEVKIVENNFEEKVKIEINYRKNLNNFYAPDNREFVFSIPEDVCSEEKEREGSFPKTFVLASLKSFAPIIEKKNDSRWKTNLLKKRKNVWKDLKLNLLYKMDGLQCKSPSIKGGKVYIRLYEVL